MDKAQITSKEAFIAACAEIGYTEVTHDTQIKDYAGATQLADVSCKLPGGRYDLALQRNEKTGKYDMQSDWWGIRGELRSSSDSKYRHLASGSDSELQDFMIQNTTKHTIANKYRREGYRVAISENAQTGAVNIKLSKAD